MDLSELRSRVRRLTSINSTAILTDADLNQVINEVYREVTSLNDWPFLNVEDTVALSADARSVTLPASVREVRSVVLYNTPNRDRLHNVTYDEIEVLFDNEDDRGEPVVYAIKDEDTLYVHPPADQAYTLEFRGLLKVTDLSLDTDEPQFDDEFHPIIAYATASRLLAEEGDDSNRVERYGEEAAAYLARLQDRYLATHDHGVFQMGGRNSRRLRNRRWSAEGRRWRV